MATASIVVPCFNEGARLDDRSFLGLISDGRARLLFVDDGSRDDTAVRLSTLKAAAPASIDVLTLQKNGGKAEAVRRGLLRALGGGAEVVGYLDADLSTPVTEVLRLLDVMGTVDVLLAARVSMLGRDIRRQTLRHYLGRVFASVASLMLGIAVYDTQCGAKLFRRTPQLEAALSQPFISRWTFDVELLGRLLAGAPGLPGLRVDRIVEEPLRAWRDVPGSKLRPRQMAMVIPDLVRVAVDLRRRRLAAGTSP